MKKTLGYGFKLSSESLIEAVRVYYGSNGFCKNKKEVIEDIARGSQSKAIPKNAKPRTFRVVIEVQE